MSTEVSEALRRFVAERAYGVCEYCLVHQEDLFHGCEMDHVVSRKHGGATTADNLAFACFHCNRHKGTDVGSITASSGELIRLFNPRTDAWRRHFQWDNGRIEPLTDVGEVTARLLGFNHPERVALRSLLAEIGRYPSVGALASVRE